MADTRYFVVLARAYGNPEQGYGIAHHRPDNEEFVNRAAAISHGFTLGCSDDFNVATLIDGRLAAVGWMDRDFGTDDFIGLAEELGLEVHRG